MAENNNENQQIQKIELSQSERFTRAVEKEFSGGVGNIQLTSFQRKLCQNYFIKIDMVLKDNESKRMAKAEQYREALPFTWDNVNLAKLSIDVITFSSVGLDPVQANHISPIPFKNKTSNKWEFTFITGYKGTELKAKKYGIDIPDEVIVELVYSTDKFKAIKKDKDHPFDNYTFEITDEFNRGEIVGGFYYHSYKGSPEKNKLRVFSWKDIEKRKPDYASAEFWGGEKDKWEYDEASGKNKKVGKVNVEGWKDEMAWKTIYKAAWNIITIDSEKIDDHYLKFIQRERDARDEAVLNDINDNANRTEIGFKTDEQVEEVGHENVVSETASQNEPPAAAEQPAPQTVLNGKEKAPF
jgi:recombination protein RecT